MNNVMTLEELAAFLKVSPSTVYRLLKKHKIPAFKMGSDWRFNQESVEQWIAERETSFLSQDEVVQKIEPDLAEKHRPVRRRAAITGRSTISKRSTASQNT